MNATTQTPASATKAPKAAKAPKAPKVTKKAEAGAPKKAPQPARVPKDVAAVHAKSTGALREAAKRYEHDKTNKTSGGHVSVNNGDKVAKMLLGKDLESVYKLAAETLGEPMKDLKTKYGHLNTGMARMCLGNKMRAIISPKK